MTVTPKVEIVPTYRNTKRMAMTPYASARLSMDAADFIDAMCVRHGVTVNLDAFSNQGPYRALLYNPATGVTLDCRDRSDPGEAALKAFRAHLETT